MGRKRITVLIAALCAWAFLSWPVRGALYIAGDANASGRVDISDAVTLLRSLFFGDQALATCPASGDWDGNGKLEVADAVSLLGHLFLGVIPPKTPDLFPGCWFGGPLDCASFDPCNPAVVIFLLDKSNSLLGPPWEKVRATTVKFLKDLPDGVEFGIVFFDAYQVMFPPTRVPTSDATMKAAAVSMVQATWTGHGACYHEALLAGLDFAIKSPAKEKVIVCMGDGQAFCNGQDLVQYQAATLKGVAAKNNGQVQINTLGVGVVDPFSSAVRWLQRLADQNGGYYVKAP